MVMHSVASVCLSVCVYLYCSCSNFERLDLNTSFFVSNYIFRISRSCLCIKVIGSRSRYIYTKYIFAGDPPSSKRGTTITVTNHTGHHIYDHIGHTWYPFRPHTISISSTTVLVLQVVQPRFVRIFLTSARRVAGAFNFVWIWRAFKSWETLVYSNTRDQRNGCLLYTSDAADE